MAAGTPLSVRLDAETHAALQAAARAAGRSTARQAAELIRAGLSGAVLAAPAGDDHPLVEAVSTMFDHVEGADADLQREAALVLAKVAAAGGPPAVAAAKELRAIGVEIDRLLEGRPTSEVRRRRGRGGLRSV